MVVDLARGLQKVRTVRRMPQEFRWNADLLELIDVTPWSPKPKTVEGPKSRSMYITERMIDAHGPTDRCPKCSTGRGQHSPECRQRFEQIQADLLNEKLEAEERKGAEKDASASSSSGPAPTGAAATTAAEVEERGTAGSPAAASNADPMDRVAVSPAPMEDSNPGALLITGEAGSPAPQGIVQTRDAGSTAPQAKR